LESAAIGFLTGLLTTQLFTLPTLLEVRRVKPILILRRQMQDEDLGYASWFSANGLSQRLPQIAAAILILAGLSAIATWLSSSALVGIAFAVGLAVALLTLLAASRLLLWACRKFLTATRLLLPQWLRHGLANLYRPGNQTASVLAALGVGVMLSMTIFFVQKMVIQDLREQTPKDLPNAFFVDISPSEVEGVKALVNAQPGIAAPMETIPVVAARMVTIDGKTPTGHHQREDGPPDKSLNPTRQRTVSLSWSEKVPAGVSILQGKWWTPGDPNSDVSIGDRAAARFSIHIGSKIEFEASGHPILATVVAIHKYNNLRAGSRSEFLFPAAALQGLPTIWYGAVHMRAAEVPALQRVMFAKFPTVSVVDLADALRIVDGVVDNISHVIEFLAGFCIFSAIVLLASSVAGTRYRRIRETVVMKTLGATRARIGAILTVEFLLLGGLGSAVGLVFAHGLSAYLLHSFELTYHFEIAATLCAIVATALLAASAGWAACFRILGQKPLAVLREE
jgi:putative ABC transport system permease protein